jgi:hypothetical protein
MDPINPWLDPVEVRRLAERLMRPVRDPALSCTEAGFGATFVGFAGPRPNPQESGPAQFNPEPPPTPIAPPVVPPPAPPLETHRQDAPVPAVAPPVHAVVTRAHADPSEESQRPTLAAATEIRPEPEPSAARGPFLDRIHRFRDWMHHHFASTGLFILDRDGAVIYDEGNHGRLHFLARSLALASRRQGASGGNVHVKIGAGATLEVIPVDTPYGCLVLGAVVPEAMPPPAVAAVMDALSQVAAPPPNR